MNVRQTIEKLTGKDYFDKSISHQEKYEALSCSQGRYGRMLRELDNLDEQSKQGLIDQLPNFKDTVDVILFIETLAQYEGGKKYAIKRFY